MLLDNPMAKAFGPALGQVAPSSQPRGPTGHHFSYYSYAKRGSMVAIAGKGYALMACDTRQTDGSYGITSRYEPSVVKIGGTNASQDDATMLLHLGGDIPGANTFFEVLDAQIKMYQYQHGKDISVTACAKFISALLYQRRSMPYGASIALAGLDENKDGAIYHYDAFGSHEREWKTCGGQAGPLLMPFLDNQVNFQNQYIPNSGVGHALHQRKQVPLSVERAEKLIKDAFDAVTERHIEVGDALVMQKLTADGITEQYMPLKRD